MFELKKTKIVLLELTCPMRKWKFVITICVIYCSAILPQCIIILMNKRQALATKRWFVLFLFWILVMEFFCFIWTIRNTIREFNVGVKSRKKHIAENDVHSRENLGSRINILNLLNKTAQFVNFYLMPKRITLSSEGLLKTPYQCSLCPSNQIHKNQVAWFNWQIFINRFEFRWLSHLKNID